MNIKNEIQDNPLMYQNRIFLFLIIYNVIIEIIGGKQNGK